MGYDHQHLVTITATLPSTLVVDLIELQMKTGISMNEMVYLGLSHFINQTKEGPDFKKIAEQELKVHSQIFDRFGGK